MSKSSTAAIEAMNQTGQRVKRKYTLRNKAAVVPPVAQVEEIKVKRQYIHNVVVVDHGVQCPHCPNRFNHKKGKIWPNNMQRYLCGKCNLPFMVKADKNN